LIISWCHVVLCYVKEVIEADGRLDFWRVNMRPGKPLAFGEYKNIPFIGLPGNPVSAFVGYEVFVRGAIGRLSGLSDGSRSKVRARSVEEILSDGRESYLRAIIHEEDGVYLATLTGHQGSDLLSLVQADALLIIPAGVKCACCQEVSAWLIGGDMDKRLKQVTIVLTVLWFADLDLYDHLQSDE
jgi:molybdopterin molybdotransferase